MRRSNRREQRPPPPHAWAGMHPQQKGKTWRNFTSVVTGHRKACLGSREKIKYRPSLRVASVGLPSGGFRVQREPPAWFGNSYIKKSAEAMLLNGVPSRSDTEPTGQPQPQPRPARVYVHA